MMLGYVLNVSRKFFNVPIVFGEEFDSVCQVFWNHKVARTAGNMLPKIKTYNHNMVIEYNE